jgi:hypothetical protein
MIWLRNNPGIAVCWAWTVVGLVTYFVAGMTENESFTVDHLKWVYWVWLGTAAFAVLRQGMLGAAAAIAAGVVAFVPLLGMSCFFFGSCV